MNNILVITGARGIGDLIYQLPLLRSLYSTYNKKLILISNRVNKAKEVYKYEDFYSEIIDFDHERYSPIKTISKIGSFLNLINKYNSDLVILTSNTTRLMLPVFFSNCKKKIIFGTKNSLLLKDKSMDHLTNCEKIISYTHKLDLNIKEESFFLNPPISRKTTEIRHNKTIFINIDSHHDQNNWPIDNFIKIIENLLSINKKVFLNFAPSKEYFLKEIPMKLLNNTNFLCVHKKTISELIEIINSSDVVIGNESGPICLGASLKKKVHSIYLPIHTRPESQAIGGDITYYNTDLINNNKIIKLILGSINSI